ncbi:Tat pathway signal protein [Noviherbaspirillum sp.]|uniref:Tat pathway signal protein n=1 Tax=Noviherbaspirillum sp. TaxID=1926288 RepID=UPI002FE333D3
MFILSAMSAFACDVVGMVGCSAENLLLAAHAAGLKGRLSYDADASCVRIDFEETTPLRSSLFEAIPKRRCSRTAYDGTLLSGEQLRLLEQAGRGDGVSILLVTDSGQKEKIIEYVAQGNNAQFGDPEWAAEMRRWIRFNARSARRTGDGLYGAILGIPEMPGWLGKMMMGMAASAKSQNRKDEKHIRSSAAIAVLFSERDDKRHWIEAGRCFERLALQATAIDLRTVFINQPVEVAALRPRFAHFLGIGNRRADLVVRIGRGPEMARSYRRPVEQVLV